MTPVATIGATHVLNQCFSSLAVVAKYLMIATETRAMTLRIPMFPIIGTHVPR